MQPTQRFSKTIDFYHRYRPSYPTELIDLLAELVSLTPNAHIADIGAGTGKLTTLLLDKGYEVWAVEPNDAMREFAINWLASNPRFHASAGKAEATTLAQGQFDLITAAQAFHWFDLTAFRQECLRLLKPNAQVALIWNERSNDTDPAMAAYEALIQSYSIDYRKVHDQWVNPTQLADFFQNTYTTASFPYTHYLDLEGFKGRYRSCSYALDTTHPDYLEAMHQLEQLFNQFAVNDQLGMQYNSVVYYGQLT